MTYQHLTSIEMAELSRLGEMTYLSVKHIKDSIFGKVLFPDSISNARQMLWHISNNTMEIPLCSVCSNSLSWHTDNREYRKFCSKKCTGIGTADIAKRTSMMKNNGVHHTQTPEYIEKVKETTLKKYGVEHYSKTTDFKKGVQTTNIEKFGVKYPAQDISILEKMKTTTLARYGVEHYASTDECASKIKATLLERYGVENIAQLTEIQEKIKATNLQKYGFTHRMKDPEIVEEIILNKKLNYYTDEVFKKLHDPLWLKNEQLSKTINTIARELGISSSNLGKYFAKYNIPINVINQHASDAQNEINQYINSLNIATVQGSKSIIFPKEIDIFVPEHNLAIEYNGVYYHTERMGRGRLYHVNKTNQCEANGIQLLHIFDFEWNNPVQRDIWKSMIAVRLGIADRIYARQCVFKAISTDDARQFMNENHLEGFVGGNYKYGLYHNGILVQCIIISKSRYNKNYDYELIRLATLKNTLVVGGISKILDNINELRGTLITYANRRYSVGNSYNALKMTALPVSPPNVFYTSKNGSIIETRHKYQKHKLANILPAFDPEKTAWENMDANGYDRFWDCGNLVFTFHLK